MANDRDELVRMAEAARRLGLSRSTLTRYLRRHPELVEGEGRDRRVRFAALTRHRGENLSVADQADAPRAAPGRGESEDPRREKARIEAKLAELDLGERVGELVRKDVVIEAYGGAIGGLFRRVDGEAAAALRSAGVTEVAEAQAAMRALIESARRDAAAELRQALAA